MLSSRSLAKLFLGLLLLAGAGWLALSLGLPYGRFPQPRLVTIPSHSSRWQIARQLERQGVIRSQLAFDLWVASHAGQTLKAGSYRFAEPASAIQIFRRLARGDVFYFSFTVPEGFNRYEIAHALQRDKIAPASAFLAATQDPRLVRDLDPDAVSLEGYLFPDTYRIAPGTSAAQIAALMVARFRQELHQEQWPALKPHDNSTPPEPISLHEWVTIASLVEKESAVAAERPVIAGIFYNRLRQKLPLQCDPTVIYAALLANDWHGAIHRADLQRNTPYNTYLHAGLPPGPIANPGRSALQAAAHPAATVYLYFVSNGEGSHRFASTLTQQNHNVQLYLREEEGLHHVNGARLPRLAPSRQ